MDDKEHLHLMGHHIAWMKNLIIIVIIVFMILTVYTNYAPAQENNTDPLSGPPYNSGSSVCYTSDLNPNAQVKISKVLIGHMGIDPMGMPGNTAYSLRARIYGNFYGRKELYNRVSPSYNYYDKYKVRTDDDGSTYISRYFYPREKEGFLTVKIWEAKSGKASDEFTFFYKYAWAKSRTFVEVENLVDKNCVFCRKSGNTFVPFEPSETMGQCRYTPEGLKLISEGC